MFQFYIALYCPLNGHAIIRRYTVAVTGSVVISLSNRSTNNTLNPQNIRQPRWLSNCVAPEHKPEALFLHSFPFTYRGELRLGAAIICFLARLFIYP